MTRSSRNGRYQRLGIGHSDVVNRTALGRALRAACRSTALIDLLPGYGYFDGGCRSLAEALVRVAGGTARLVYVGRRDRLDHAVCRIRTPSGFVYLDGDGLASQGDLKAKIAEIELGGIAVEAVRIRSFSRRAQEDSDIPHPPEIPTRIATRLGRRLRDAIAALETDGVEIEATPDGRRASAAQNHQRQTKIRSKIHFDDEALRP